MAMPRKKRARERNTYGHLNLLFEAAIAMPLERRFYSSPCAVRWRLSNSERKRFHSIARTCGLPGEHGGWWFWPRRSH